MSYLAWVGAAAVLVCGLTAAGAEKSTAAAEQPTGRYFEVRTYIANEGKFDALHARFRDHTNRIFKKHGIEVIGYWVPTDPAKSKNTLVYMLAYPSKEARDAAWKAFRADPEWIAAKAKSEEGGGLVGKVIEEFFTATDYSPIK
ncbi:MAG: NIPSNAP family protein [Phycisphaerae bacterium]|nr:NIPSNAP family protein [Tepidisphaeraceae bacterium]